GGGIVTARNAANRARCAADPPHRLLIEPIVRRALEEDLGRAGDLTTDLLIPAEARARAVIAARESGVTSGLVAAEVAFHIIDSAIRVEVLSPDGSVVSAGETIAAIEGPARAL